MIKIKNLSFSYGKEQILKNISISFPHYGLISICGPSGCGKTTFMNCICGILNYSGEININGVELNNLSQNEMDEYRLKNIGFVFQDFKLFSNDNVEQNILFPLDSICNYSYENKIRKINDLVEITGIEKIRKNSIENISGGEKQRVAIARALVNDPKIILADEPTGSLDNENSKQIMNILAKIAKKTLVIVVSHDNKLMESYSDVIIEMRDGIIESERFNQKIERDIFLPLSQNKFSNKKTRISSKFLIRHSRQSLKRRKWRTLISNCITSLSLLGIGLATALSNTISWNIKDSYSAIVDKDNLFLEKENMQIQRVSANVETVNKLASKYKNSIYGVGAAYQNNFEEMFPNGNYASIGNGRTWERIEGFSSRTINDFRWLDNKKTTIYPSNNIELNDDEIIISINYPIIEKICYSLRIERSLDSLSDFLLENTFQICFDFKNDDWMYWDQQIFNVVGFTFEPIIGIYHNNHLWNEYVFEELMRLPFTYNIERNDNKPWTLKKTLYFNAIKPESLLKEIEYDVLSDDLLFDIANESIFPSIYRDSRPSERNRILVYESSNKLPFRIEKDIANLDDHIYSIIYGSYGGYAMYPDYLMMGFAKPSFFSSEINKVESVSDSYTLEEKNEAVQMVLPDGVLMGHYSKSMQNGIIFEEIDDNLIYGKSPETFNEIVISSSLSLKLFGKENSVNSVLYGAFCTKELLDLNSGIQREFAITEFKVVGIKKSSRNSIFHDRYWTIGFYKMCLGISAFELDINCFAVKTSGSTNTLEEKLKKAFPNLKISNPTKSVFKSVDDICKYVEIALVAFSSVSVIVSIILLALCNYLHLIECYKDIGLARCLGLPKKETKKFVFFHSFVLCISAFMMSAVELTFVTLISSYELSKTLNSKFEIYFNPLSYILMLCLACLISLISSFFLSKNSEKISPLSCLKK